MINKKIQLNQHICPHCNYQFGRGSELNRHLTHKSCKGIREKELIKNITEEVTTNVYSKLVSNKTIKLKPIGYISSQSESDPELKNKVQYLEKQIAEQNEKIAKLSEKPHNIINNNLINNNLQIICIGNNDNYLDMLTDKWSSFDKALEYIRDCALSNLTGDCKLIEKIYLETSDQTKFPAMRFIGKNRTQIEYFNEQKEMVVDSKELFGRKLANNLQNSYLKGVNYLITENLSNQRCPNKFLEDYDLQTWNQHIYDLSSLQYQKKIINNLNISH